MKKYDFEHYNNMLLPLLMNRDENSTMSVYDRWQIRREEIKALLCEEIYGFRPDAPEEISFEIISEDKKFCAGKAVLSKVLMKTKNAFGAFSFPIYCSVPAEKVKYPAFVHINFRDHVPDKYLPSEELCDRGFAVFSFCYQDVCADENDNFAEGLGKLLYPDGKREKNSCGKIGMWSWAASRVADYLETLDCVDLSNIAVVGHSRLGKTALLTGALDERFQYVISNDSGCSGAAITREKEGERVNDICSRFPYWFCENYEKYADHEDRMPFDQHFLLALTAPRKLYVASASLDLWADPYAEYLSCIKAGEAYSFYNQKGFVFPKRFPRAGEAFQEGNIGYHLRPGLHYLSRYDWNRFCDFIESKMKA